MKPIAMVLRSAAVLCAGAAAAEAQLLQYCPENTACVESVTSMNYDEGAGTVNAFTTATADYNTAFFYEVCASLAILRYDGAPPYGWSVPMPMVSACAGAGSPGYNQVTIVGQVVAYPGFDFGATGGAYVNAYFTYQEVYPDCLIYCSGYWADVFGYGLLSTTQPPPGPYQVPYAITPQFTPTPRPTEVRREDMDGSLGFAPVPFPTITLASNGASVPTDGNGTAYIDADPQGAGPRLSLVATASPPPNPQVGLYWNLLVNYTRDATGGLNCRPGHGDPPMPYTSSTPYASQGPGAGNVFDIGAAMGSYLLRGGTGSLTISVSTPASSRTSNPPVNFKIRGNNPAANRVRAELQSRQPPWFGSMVINQESSFLQFNTGAVHPAEPNWGPPCGWGLGQIDPPTDAGLLWNWQANITEALRKMAVGNRDADWADQISAFNQARAIDPNLQPPCSEQPSQWCKFEYIPTRADNVPGTPKPLGDANWILVYNKGEYTNLRYVKWDGAKKRWIADGGTETYVNLVCSKSP